MKHLGTVKIYRTYYLLDDVHDGDFPRDDVRLDSYSDVDAHEAVKLLRDWGVEFRATGNAGWASLPDGSYTVNYATGQECQVDGFVEDFPDRLTAAIEVLVDRRPTPHMGRAHPCCPDERELIMATLTIQIEGLSVEEIDGIKADVVSAVETVVEDAGYELGDPVDVSWDVED